MRYPQPRAPLVLSLWPLTVGLAGCGSSTILGEEEPTEFEASQCVVEGTVAWNTDEAWRVATCAVSADDAELLGLWGGPSQLESGPAQFNSWSFALRVPDEATATLVHLSTAGRSGEQVSVVVAPEPVFGAECAPLNSRLVSEFDGYVGAALELFESHDTRPLAKVSAHDLCFGEGFEKGAPTVFLLQSEFQPDCCVEPYQQVTFDATGGIGRICWSEQCRLGQDEYCCP